MVILGIVRASDAVAVLLGEWNVFGFFLGLMLISAIADRAGFFDALALYAGRAARRRAVAVCRCVRDRRAADLAAALKRFQCKVVRMKVLCALGARDGAASVRRVLAIVGEQAVDLLLVFVIDAGPRHGLEAWGGALRQRPHLGPDRLARIDSAEERSGEVVLAEARAYAAQTAGVRVTTQLLRGQPERVIVERTVQGDIDLVAISAREGLHSALSGPESVGHVARYVLDHARCDVLLIRG